MITSVRCDYCFPTGSLVGMVCRFRRTENVTCEISVGTIEAKISYLPTYIWIVILSLGGPSKDLQSGESPNSQQTATLTINLTLRDFARIFCSNEQKIRAKSLKVRLIGQVP